MLKSRTIVAGCISITLVGLAGCGFNVPDGGGRADPLADRPDQPSSEQSLQDEGDLEPVDLSDLPPFGGGEATGKPVRFRLSLAADTQNHYFFDHDSTAGIRDWRCGSATYDGHRGTDFVAPKNTPVYAAADGIIIQKVDVYGDGCYPCTDPCGPSYPAANRCQAPNGNFVRLQHATVGGKHVTSVYLHLEKGSVTTKPERASVSCGELIGRVGRSGSATGYHLHFETQLVDSIGNKTPFDPYGGPCGEDSTSWVSQTSSGPGTSCLSNSAPDLVYPSITRVQPPTPTGSNTAQPFTIHGTNFNVGATVTLRDVTAGQVFPNRRISSQTASSITINPILTTAAHTWSVEVTNPDGLSSGEFTFSVISPGPTPPTPPA